VNLWAAINGIQKWVEIIVNVVMNQVGNSKFPPSGHLIFFFTNIRNENKTREI
jgi:hypothetical protein